jgi:hypothetical protein
MPVRYKPELNHIGFDWFRDSNIILQELLAREIDVLTKLGFYEEYGPHSDPTFTGHTESIALMNEISGVLSLAAVILMDAGFKAPRQLIATLKSIERNHSLIFTHSIEPEALGMLSLCYQRGDEPPGLFWFDIDRPENAPLPDPDRVRAAASKAIAALEAEASPGRPPNNMIEFLALRFREIFLRFNDRVTRHSVESSRVIAVHRKGNSRIPKTKPIQREGGPFIEFLESVLPPLNGFFASLPKDYGAGRVSASAVAEVLRDRRSQKPEQDIPQQGSLSRLPYYSHNFRREPRGSFVFDRHMRIAHEGSKSHERNLHSGIPARDTGGT